MSVQVRSRREAAAFLSTYVGAQGELLVDTTNNRVQVHDGATPGGSPAAKLSEVITNTRTPVADAAYTALATDRTITVTSLTAARTITLPAASAYPTGTQLLIFDESGNCSATNTITIARAGSDTINGASSASMASAYGYLALESNGVGKWTIIDQTPTASGGGGTAPSRTTVADANYTALTTDRTVAYATLTSARTVTLPAASAYPTGVQLFVVDESGNAAATRALTIARVGSDTINGASSAVIAQAFGFLALISNGTGKWTIVDFAGATQAQLTNRNAAVNGNFAINQRGYTSGTSLAAGTYAHDRWKAGSGGCTYTFTQGASDTSVTITAGTLIQAVDAPNVYATSYWLSWTGTATARVWQGSASGSYAASPILVTGLTIGTIANLEFATGTLGTVQFEAALPGAGPTTFERRGNELTLCRLYFRYGTPGIGTWYTGGASAGAQLQFNYDDMRAPSQVPTLSLLVSSVTVADPGVTNCTFPSVQIGVNSAGGGSATINFSGGSGGQSPNPATNPQTFHVALLVTPNCIGISKEI